MFSLTVYHCDKLSATFVVYGLIFEKKNTISFIIIYLKRQSHNILVLVFLNKSNNFFCMLLSEILHRKISIFGKYSWKYSISIKPTVHWGVDQKEFINKFYKNCLFKSIYCQALKGLTIDSNRLPGVAYMKESDLPAEGYGTLGVGTPQCRFH